MLRFGDFGFHFLRFDFRGGNFFFDGRDILGRHLDFDPFRCRSRRSSLRLDPLLNLILRFFLLLCHSFQVLFVLLLCLLECWQILLSKQHERESFALMWEQGSLD